MSNKFQPTQEDLDRHYSVRQLLEIQDNLNNFLYEGKTTEWVYDLSYDKLLTALLDEMCEFIGSKVQWKWWKSVPIEAFDAHNAKIELVDAVHFFLSMMILKIRTSGVDYASALSCPCPPDKKHEFKPWELYYVGVDRGATYPNAGLLNNVHNLNHTNFITLVSGIMASPSRGIWHMLDMLDMLVSSGGMTSEVFSAYFAAKSALNEYRFTIGNEYEKVDPMGREDNERLEALIQVFLDDKSMSLNGLRQNVRDEFFAA